MPSYTENALTAAINAVNTGTPLRRAASDYGILETILRGRRVNRCSRGLCHLLGLIVCSNPISMLTKKGKIAYLDVHGDGKEAGSSSGNIVW